MLREREGGREGKVLLVSPSLSQPPFCFILALHVHKPSCSCSLTLFVFQDNCLILKEVVDLRARKAALLGFDTHADFVLEMNMAKNCKTVMTFLGEASA